MFIFWSAKSCIYFSILVFPNGNSQDFPRQDKESRMTEYVVVTLMVSCYGAILEAMDAPFFEWERHGKTLGTSSGMWDIHGHSRFWMDDIHRNHRFFMGESQQERSLNCENVNRMMFHFDPFWCLPFRGSSLSFHMFTSFMIFYLAWENRVHSDAFGYQTHHKPKRLVSHMHWTLFKFRKQKRVATPGFLHLHFWGEGSLQWVGAIWAMRALLHWANLDGVL